MNDLRPQKGFQEKALATAADIAILGGAAGAGKTWVELLEPLRHMQNKYFRSVIFRRSMPQITGPGGLWDASLKIYPFIGASSRESLHDWEFTSGARLFMRQIEHEKNLNDWQGTEIDLIQFDELTHFTLKMFTYFLSRGRSSTSGIRPYIRATCNPDPDSWVADFISWWIDQETGFPIEERAGVLRYMTRSADSFIWGDSVEEVLAKAPHLIENETVRLTKAKIDPRDLIKTVTFIPGKLHENAKLLQSNPAYLGSLMAMGEEEQASLLKGNWLVRLNGLDLFQPGALKDLFSNYPTENRQPLKCITCDPARFGRDFCVIYVWKDWEVIHISIFKKSDVHDIVNHIETLRHKFNVSKRNVVVDQNGVGDDTVKLGQYEGFYNNAKAMKDPESRIVENYENLKTQCYYRVAKRVNEGQIRLNVTNGTVYIYDDSKLGPKYSMQIKVGSEVKDVRDLIKADLKAVKRGGFNMEKKLKINTKEEQKAMLNGRSPDFGDPIAMREFIELRPDAQKIKVHY